MGSQLKHGLIALVWIALVAAGACAYSGATATKRMAIGAPARSELLEFPRSCREAKQLVDQATLAERQRAAEVLALDGRATALIGTYTLVLMLAAGWAAKSAAIPPPWSALLIGLAASVGLFDVGESMGLRGFLQDPRCNGERLVAGIRMAAQAKDITLMIVVLVCLTGWGAALRKRFGAGADMPPESRIAAWIARGAGWLIRKVKRASAADTTRSSNLLFGDLIRHEDNAIFSSDPGRADTPRVNCYPKEPWITFREADVVGLALSGGGIRSATFNLGFLQGLERLGLVALIDYLATVSGGGYLGGFWSAWLARARSGPQSGFPVGSGETAGSLTLTPPAEPSEVKHLRQFSRFLAPRVGFFEAEMWYGVVAVLAGLLPAMNAALSVLGLTLIGWLSLTFFLACKSVFAAVVTAGALTLVALWQFEFIWEDWAKPDPLDEAIIRRTYWATAALTLALTCLGHYFLPLLYDVWRLPNAYYTSSGAPFDGTAVERWRIWNGGAWTSAATRGTGAYDAWWRLIGIDRVANDGWFFSPRLFDPAMVWFVVAELLFVVRGALSIRWGSGRERRVRAPAFDRAVMRVLAAGVLWLLFGVLWHVSVNLPYAKTFIVATFGTGGLFALLRNWIGIALRDRPQKGPLDSLKQFLPMVLAYATVGLAFVALGTLLVALCGTDWRAWWIAAFVMALSVLAILLFDPAELGLHAFYRDRLARAYLGASNPRAGANTQTDVRYEDDLPLSALADRPLHLVCCAANDLDGDPITTLSRGARSAVLSRHGVSLGRRFAPTDTSLAAAMTASAAAFNPSMGSVSMRVGPAVGFLMCALNLRLGLWVPNPEHPSGGTPPRERSLPGLLFYKEMFGLIDASAASPEIHLSDGGHFDNLALYELVRRHCRYIIVSDCGQDLEVAFDDFGNAARRIREDFGIDLDVDLDPLRIGPNGTSRQHVAVGTIHYGTFDKGVLIYVKPAITGDEPPDVLQYRTRNARFPHEPTSDQFYDEAQWESYRRLGEHTAAVAFGFANHLRSNGRTPTSDLVFTQMRQIYTPIPAGLADRALEMTASIGKLEAELLRDGREELIREIFPELRDLGSVAAAEVGEPAKDATAPASASASGRVPLHDLIAILRVTQTMEDVFTACQLDDYWNHPINMGWTNTFARWATAPTFRMWWPLIAPMYGSDFGRFLNESFGVARCDPAKPGGRIVPIDRLTDGGLAARAWRDDTLPAARRQGGAFAYEVTLTKTDGSECPIQVAVAAVMTTAGEASWSADDFYVPPSLWGAGIGGRFLSALLGYLAASHGVSVFKVDVAMPPDRADDTARITRANSVEFYKRHRFRLDAPSGEATTESVGLTLRFPPQADAVSIQNALTPPGLGSFRSP